MLDPGIRKPGGRNRQPGDERMMLDRLLEERVLMTDSASALCASFNRRIGRLPCYLTPSTRPSTRARRTLLLNS